MRIPRFRFRLRILMIAVAIVGTILGTLAERRARFKRLSIAYQEAWEGLRVSDLELYLIAGLAQGESNEAAEIRKRRSEPLVRFCQYTGKMASKYEQAAEQPWRPVEPDPPPQQIDPADVETIMLYLDFIAGEHPGPPRPR